MDDGSSATSQQARAHFPLVRLWKKKPSSSPRESGKEKRGDRKKFKEFAALVRNLSDSWEHDSKSSENNDTDGSSLND